MASALWWKTVPLSSYLPRVRHPCQETRRWPRLRNESGELIVKEGGGDWVTMHDAAVRCLHNTDEAQDRHAGRQTDESKQLKNKGIFTSQVSGA